MDSETAIEKIEELCDLIDENIVEIAEKGVAFFEDVREKLVDVSSTIENSHRCTLGQEKAIGNWEAGLRRWIHDD